MAVERVTHGQETPVHRLESEPRDGYSLTHDDLLAFLWDVRADERRCSSLNYGLSLLIEAAEEGLFEEDGFEEFCARMIELRDSGLANWTSAAHDHDGDDLLYAAEFHLTARGRLRLRAAGGGLQP